ncbi:MAG: hypothetical protein IJW49_04470 [Clostridia bacterium]|nr:hypothetical protein [Clostridia bacterium]
MSDCKARPLACETALRGLRETIAVQSAQIPLQNGIFVGAEDRSRASMAACRLLMSCESLTADLRTAISALASNGCVEQCERWRLFYEQTVTAFFVRFEAAADLVGNGEGCNPTLLISLCRDFCESADLFLKKETDISR